VVVGILAFGRTAPAMVGAAGCLLLVATPPWRSVAVGLVVLAVGLAGRAVVLSRRAR
jgi:basic amino acid/polyamine antiporter, APA family